MNKKYVNLLKIGLVLLSLLLCITALSLSLYYNITKQYFIGMEISYFIADMHLVGAIVLGLILIPYFRRD